MSSAAFSRYTWRTLTLELWVVLAAVVVCVPLYFLVTISLKTTPEAYTAPLAVPTSPNWQSYSEAFGGQGASGGIGRALANSVIITVGSVISLIALGSIAAFALARWQSRLSNVLYIFFVVGIIIPAQLGLIPLYVTLRQFGLTETYFGMIVLYTGLLMPLTVFLYAGFFRAMPRDYEEAAQVDGASPTRTFVRVVLPLMRPITGTVAMLASLLIWNDFFVQLVFLGASGNATLPVEVYSLASANVAKWNVIFAGVAIAVLPMLTLFLIAQRTMIRGFTGGIRG